MGRFHSLTLAAALTSLFAASTAGPQTTSQANPRSARVKPSQLSNIDDPANLKGERVPLADPSDTLPINHGPAALEQLLRKLRTRASMMMIVAHPDDEDGGLLTYESRGVGARVAMLTLTRGEGGQNLMSADFDDALGLVRTQELLAADRYMGVDQMFGTEVDFGFSKTKEETFKKWTHDRVLYDAVRAVRLYRPLVLASVFVGGVTDGHGHHQVAGEITQEVFKAAADPKVFPEMLLEPWAPLKVYAHVPFSRVEGGRMFDYATGRSSPARFHNYVTGADIDHEPAPSVVIQEGAKSDLNVMQGDTWVQWARRGLALQKSQIGAGVRVPPAGAYDVGYTLMATRLPCPAAPCSIRPAKVITNSPAAQQETSLFDGIDTTLAGISSEPATQAKLRELDRHLAEAQRLFDPAQVDRTVPPMIEALRILHLLVLDASHNTRDADRLHELKVKQAQLEQAIAIAAGIEVTASADRPIWLTSDKSVELTLTLANRGKQRVRTVGVGFAASTLPAGFNRSGDVSKAYLEAGSTETLHERFDLPVPEQATQPYFSRRGIEQPYYDVAEPELRNAPATPSPLIASVFFEVDGQEIDVFLPVQAAASGTAATHDDPRERPARHALFAVPPVSLALMPALGVFPAERLRQSVTLHLTAQEPSHPVSGSAFLEAPAGWKIAKASLPFTTGSGSSNSAAQGSVVFDIATPSHPANTILKPVARIGDQSYRESVRPVGYSGLPVTFLFTPATFRAVAVDLHTAPGLRVAYVSGTGDEIAALLPNLGINPAIINPADLTPATLRSFDVVMLGVRAYNAHPDLAGGPSKALLDFAREGGIVVAQYNTGNFPPAALPFPLNIPGDPAHNVVEEEQPVRIATPAAPVLTWPNRITSADFNGWVAERGHGFASSFAPQFQAPLEMHDVDQDPQRGGLLIAPVGKGAYVYCALALYRQLPEGVPGAYRLLGNLLSLGKNPAFLEQQKHHIQAEKGLSE